MSVTRSHLVLNVVVAALVGAAIGALYLVWERSGDETAAESHAPVPEWPADGTTLGQVSGVAVDRSGDVLVFHRAGRTWEGEPIDADERIAEETLIRFDAETGAQLAAWGAGRFAMPHGLAVAPDGDVWLTDVGLHQVFAVDGDGKTLLVLGEQGVPGDDAAHFDMPTDVAVAQDGTVYVSDGYRNARVVRFSSEGERLLEWGSRGTAPGQFDTPHGIAVDVAGRVYVADRGNARLQIFDGEGRLLDVWEGPEYGRPWAVRVGADGAVYVVDGGDQLAEPPDRSRVLVCDSDGNVVAELGSYGTAPGEFVWPHAVAVGSDGAIYVGEVSTTMRVQKLVPASPDRRAR